MQIETEKQYITKDCFMWIPSFSAELCSENRKKRVSLSATEYRILSFFIKHRNHPVYLEELAAVVWGHNDIDKNPDSLKSHLTRIRSKLEQIQPGLRYCLVTNVGYSSYTLTGMMTEKEDVQNDAHEPARNSKSPQESSGQVKPHYPRDTFDGSSQGIIPVQYRDLLKLGYTPMSIAEALVENDWKLYGPSFEKKGIAKENEGSPVQWAEYLSSVPESFQYLINEKHEIIGNFSFVSISLEQEELYLSGQLFESAFSPDYTRDMFCPGRDHIMFLLNLSVNDEYSDIKTNNMLRKMFLEQLVRFAENDIYFCKIVTNVYRASQEAFYKQWGFQYVKDQTLSGKIYQLEMFPYPDRLNRQLSNSSLFSDVNERLKKLYE